MSERAVFAGIVVNDRTVLNVIRDILKTELGRTDDISLSTDLLADLQLDSIDLLTLVVGLENHFEIYLEIEAEVGLTSISELIHRVLLTVETQGNPAGEAAFAPGVEQGANRNGCQGVNDE